MGLDEIVESKLQGYEVMYCFWMVLVLMLLRFVVRTAASCCRQREEGLHRWRVLAMISNDFERFDDWRRVSKPQILGENPPIERMISLSGNPSREQSTKVENGSSGIR